MQAKHYYVVNGQKVSGVVHQSEKQDAACVITSHGLLSHKDSDKYIELANRLVEARIALFRFDFLGCGESQGSMEDCTTTGRRKELRSAVRFVKEGLLLGRPLGLMGSSLGGYLSLFQAASGSGTGGVVVWATPHGLSGITRPADDGTTFPGDAFFEDFKHNDLLPELGKVRRCLVIHGSEDETVPVEHARTIYESLAEPKRLEIIPGADHRFTDEKHREKAYRLTVEWFKKYLQI